jgi:glyoxylase-like metal-dependent hydrolase (beta-lactamase superfamily II)
MVELVPDVHSVDGSIGCNTYLIIDKGVTLVDTGLRGNEKLIYGYLKKLGYEPTDIKRIVITHAHFDHINCLYNLKKETNAEVIVGETDADIVTGKMPLRTMGGVFARSFNAFMFYYRYKPVPVDRMLKDGDVIDVIGGLRAVMLSGHSHGNMGLYSQARRLVFSSDTIRVIDHKLMPPHPRFTENMHDAIQAIKRLAELDFDVLLPGHGSPVMTGASEKVKELYHELKH